MYLSLFVSELPILVDLKGDQRVYVRVDGPLGDAETLDPATMDQRLQDFWKAAAEKLKAKHDNTRANEAGAQGQETPKET